VTDEAATTSATTWCSTTATSGSTRGRRGADLTWSTREVRRALSRGELNAQQALEAGRLKLRGDIGTWPGGAALTIVTDVFAAVRAATAY